MRALKEQYDVAVIGGGMSGICAALAAARMGARTVLIQDRPVLGGNASSEIRMHIAGATRHGQRANLRETGIIEEILLENKYRNPEHSYGMFDALLWEKAKYQENLSLYLNTIADSVKVQEHRVIAVSAYQTTTEKMLEITAEQFIDCTGDGLIAYLAGAEYMFGREGKEIFSEPNAVEHSDTVTMGNSIQFRALDAGRPVPFVRPSWAYDYSEAEWASRISWVEITSGYWWLELGGTEWNVVDDAELTRDEMMKIIFGIWDYIKNYSNRKAEAANLYLDWVSFLPAKRESRRILGDYVLKEQDVLENRIFEDAIAYGGWHLDSHRPEGFYAFINNTPCNGDAAVAFEGIYTIPYRSIYARGIQNLFLGGRIISASHRAFSSTRVMATCAVEGQAAGVAAFLACRDHLSTAENIRNIHQLQQELLKQGCYIPGFQNEDKKDLARMAEVSADSFLEGCEPENVINGISRPVGEQSNMWVPADSEHPHSISLKWEKPKKLERLYITLDSDLSAEIMISLSHWHHVRQEYSVPGTILKDYDIAWIADGKTICREKIRENHQRINVIEKVVECDTVVITALASNGNKRAGICEIRAYGAD